jgi:hypothetical protein
VKGHIKGRKITLDFHEAIKKNRRKNKKKKKKKSIKKFIKGSIIQGKGIVMIGSS